MEELEKQFFSKHDPKILSILRNSIVGIAGAGGLGSNVAFSLARAGFLTSIGTWGGLIFSPFAGYILDKGVKGKWFLLPSCLGLVCAFSLFAFGHYSLALSLALLGIAAGLIPAPVYYLLPKIVSPKNIGLGYGVVMTGLSIGVLCGP